MSILSFGKIVVDLKSSGDIKILEILYKLAKEVVIDLANKDYFFNIKEFKPENKVNETQSLIIGEYYYDINLLIQAINVFKNIKTLKLNKTMFDPKFAKKIKLPHLQYLFLENLSQI